MSDPYKPPTSEFDVISQAHQAQSRFWNRPRKLILSVAVIVPLFGLSLMVINLVRAFAELSKTGRADPALLAQDIAAALNGVVLTSLIVFPLTLFLIIDFIRFKMRKRIAPLESE